MTAPSIVGPVTCLGCGCACDDLRVELSGERIVGINPPCPLGLAWFGDGVVPDRTVVEGRPVELSQAVAGAAELLAAARGRVLVYLAPEISSQSQRTALAVADLAAAAVDTATSAPAAAGLLAAQRRGRAAATLGEVRNRADMLLFWGVDPTARYPRYLSRYALDPRGTHVPDGRAGRTVISVSVGQERGPDGAEVAISVAPVDEVAALSVMRATVLGNALGELSPSLQPFADAAGRLAKARYAVLVHDGEPGAATPSPYRAEGLIALTQALNGPTRAALSSLRAGGNRSGAEAVLTWQTGYPFAVSYADGAPRFTASRRGLDAGEAVVLVVGSPAALADAPLAAGTRAIVVGPRASDAPFAAAIAIDTGVAGIHEGGTAYRMDEVPLPLRPPLPGAREAAHVLDLLLTALRTRMSGRPG